MMKLVKSFILVIFVTASFGETALESLDKLYKITLDNKKSKVVRLTAAKEIIPFVMTGTLSSNGARLINPESLQVINYGLRYPQKNETFGDRNLPVKTYMEKVLTRASITIDWFFDDVVGKKFGPKSNINLRAKHNFFKMYTNKHKLFQAVIKKGLIDEPKDEMIKYHQAHTIKVLYKAFGYSQDHILRQVYITDAELKHKHYTSKTGEVYRKLTSVLGQEGFSQEEIDKKTDVEYNKLYKQFTEAFNIYRYLMKRKLHEGLKRGTVGAEMPDLKPARKSNKSTEPSGIAGELSRKSKEFSRIAQELLEKSKEPSGKSKELLEKSKEFSGIAKELSKKSKELSEKSKKIAEEIEQKQFDLRYDISSRAIDRYKDYMRKDDLLKRRRKAIAEHEAELQEQKRKKLEARRRALLERYRKKIAARKARIEHRKKKKYANKINTRSSVTTEVKKRQRQIG